MASCRSNGWAASRKNPCSGQRMDVLTDDGAVVPGYVGAKSHHVTSPEEKYKVPICHDMFIDVGLAERGSR